MLWQHSVAKGLGSRHPSMTFRSQADSQHRREWQLSIHPHTHPSLCWDSAATGGLWEGSSATLPPQAARNGSPKSPYPRVPSQEAQGGAVPPVLPEGQTISPSSPLSCLTKLQSVYAKREDEQGMFRIFHPPLLSDCIFQQSGLESSDLSAYQGVICLSILPVTPDGKGACCLFPPPVNIKYLADKAEETGSNILVTGHMTQDTCDKGVLDSWHCAVLLQQVLSPQGGCQAKWEYNVPLCLIINSWGHAPGRSCDLRAVDLDKSNRSGSSEIRAGGRRKLNTVGLRKNNQFPTMFWWRVKT